MPPPQPRGAGALHDVKARHDQGIATKSENHRRSVQGAQPPKVHRAHHMVDIQPRKGQMKGDGHPDQKAHHAPKGGGNHPGTNHPVHIFIRRVNPNVAHMAQLVDKGDRRRQHHDNRTRHIGQIMCVIRGNSGKNRHQPQHNRFRIIPHFASLRPSVISFKRESESVTHLLTVLLFAASGHPSFDPCQQCYSSGLININVIP